eukprot:TRINITY_DN988_c0_g2_i1.p1 TRINITY_DN988_c0_g2~~TRINITY_DN988_c0_g2_i1.p1  ORF type:complete len:145 (-),score=4.49 TRINITY_DN988_c0_g2_i1:158-592(-)
MYACGSSERVCVLCFFFVFFFRQPGKGDDVMWGERRTAGRIASPAQRRRVHEASAQQSQPLKKRRVLFFFVFFSVCTPFRRMLSGRPVQRRRSRAPPILSCPHRPFVLALLVVFRSVPLSPHSLLKNEDWKETPAQENNNKSKR